MTASFGNHHRQTSYSAFEDLVYTAMLSQFATTEYIFKQVLTIIELNPYQSPDVFMKFSLNGVIHAQAVGYTTV